MLVSAYMFGSNGWIYPHVDFGTYLLPSIVALDTFDEVKEIVLKVGEVDDEL